MNTTVAKAPSRQRLRKDAMLASFQQLCTDSEGVFIAEYSGIDVASLAQLRAAARAAGGEMRVVKNTVAKIALSSDERFAPLAEHLNGHLIYGAATSAPALAKAMREFTKDHEQLVVRAGVMDGEILAANQIAKLADLPSREEMLGILASTLNAPLTKFVRTLAEVPAAAARVLAAVRDAKAASES